MTLYSAIVTGASRGLGLELALILASKSRAVVGVSRNPPEDPRWKEFCGAGSLQIAIGDVSNPLTVIRAFDAAENIGKLDLVINCAGFGVFGAAGAFNSNDIEDVLKGNLIGTILFSDAAYKRFKINGGTIVNIMSTSANIGRPSETIYCAAKWGAKGYTEALRAESKGSAARIISVYPGGMRTDFWKNARGSTTDPRTFMNPKEAAETIMAAIEPKAAAYVSEITINRT
jgi:short-subunit dehydrogenase